MTPTDGNAHITTHVLLILLQALLYFISVDSFIQNATGQHGYNVEQACANVVNYDIFSNSLQILVNLLCCLITSTILSLQSIVG